MLRPYLSLIVLFFVGLALSPPALADTVNSFRRANGLPALARSGSMQSMAQSCASSMAARRSLDHSGFSGRAARGARAENVAYGCASESCTINMWKNSAGHRSNMLKSGVRTYGLASAAGGGQRYWCLLVGV